MDKVTISHLKLLKSQKQQRGRKGQKIYLKPNNWECPTSGINLDIQLHETYKSPSKFNLKRSSPRHSIIKFSKFKGKEIIIKVVRAKKLATIWNANKPISGLLSKNLIGHKRVRLYIQSAKRKQKLPTKSILSWNVFLKKWRQNTFFFWQNWKNSTLLDLQRKKYWKEFFKLR